ncbi:hypothetical protein E2C01_094183 [Portunus trituberculatus]|uniref:Uncharacterized protein n=1 Tax=Portunus trituberculatus TaxID=210409 RepID=A0A5B7JL73_PORTR|nr:hypothetical protein [Portunus trituberculatus]
MRWVVLIIGLGISLLLGSHLRETSEHVRCILRTLQTWQEDGLFSTTLWLLREHLSYQWWLGPLRPNPPQDPAKDYVSHAGTPSWILMFKPHETRQRLSRLEQHIRKAKEDHAAFKRNIMWFMVLYVLLAVGLFLTRLLVLFYLFPNSMSSTSSLFKETQWLMDHKSETSFAPGSVSRS